tara:strand:- start:45 stop:551 length:507 start_codon:yes stop_codon:yes gene_type:complete
MKTCTKCGIEKPLDAEHFHRRSSSPSGFQYNCKVCELKRKAEYYSRPEVKERNRLRCANWHKEAKSNQPACVYQIVNSVNNKIYIGQTMRGELRWKEHLQNLRNGNTGKWNPNLQADFNKLGEDAFEWSIIKEYPKDKKLLEGKEKQLIKQYEKEGKQLYNILITENK